MLILAAADNVWYESPFFVAVLSITLTLLTGRFTGYMDRRSSRRREAQLLKAGLKAEISTIQAIIAQTAQMCIDHGERITAYPRACPRKFFEANVGRLGELDDPTLSQGILAVYSSLDSVFSLMEQMKDEEPFDEEKEREYFEAGIRGEVRDLYLSGLLHIDLKGCMALHSMTTAKGTDDELIQRTNEMFDRITRVQGSPAGKMFRQNGKLMLTINLEPDTWSRGYFWPHGRNTPLPKKQSA
jgi:hypothetical protein